MLVGAIGSSSEVIEWMIKDPFSHIGKRIDIQSPIFLLAGCTWQCQLIVECKEIFLNGFLRAVIVPETTFKEVKCAFGIKRKDGTLEEKPCRVGEIGKRKIFFNDCFIFLNDLQKRMDELVPSGTLTVTCRMETPTPEEMAPDPSTENTLGTKQFVELETLSSDFKDLLSSERKCDVTLNVQGKEFRAHRIVLGARSSVFRAMYEHDTAEAKTGVLTIPDCDPDTFGEFLNFLYTGRTEGMSFMSAYHLYATADKYDLQQLKTYCAHYVTQNINVENVCFVTMLADRYCDDGLMSSAQEFFNNNYLKIILTSEWKALLLKNNPPLANRLLSEMASAGLKTLEKRNRCQYFQAKTVELI